MAAVSEHLFFAGIAELGAKLRAREFSAVELTRVFCDRLEKLGPRYNALALSLREQAIAQAKDVDDDIKIGRLRGPLQGIPCGVKDLVSVADQPTTWGAKPFAAQVFDYDAAVVQRLKKAQAILIGKLSLVELAGGGGYRYAAASLFGPGLNPWDRSRWSGGSSSGAGSAVAAGLLPFAIGSETSGSILTPSSYCGVTGLRPTYGLVSRYGAMALSWTMDKLGPMCRSAEDCGLVLQAIAGRDSRDSSSAGKGYYHSPQFFRKVTDLRGGYAPVDFAERAEPASRVAFQQALGVIRDMGLKLNETRLPDFPYGALAGTIIRSEGASSFESLITSGRVNDLADQKQIAGLKAGLEVRAPDYLRAMRIRSLVQKAFRELFVGVDVLIAPATFGIATKVSEPLDGGPDRPKPKDPGMSALTPAGNLAGLPAIALPCGFSDGLPVGLQIVGRPFSETNLIAIGLEFQKRTDFHKRRPPA